VNVTGTVGTVAVMLALFETAPKKISGEFAAVTVIVAARRVVSLVVYAVFDTTSIGSAVS
jgi:hypothetical protein